MFFAESFWENILTYFSKLLVKKFWFGSKNCSFYKLLAKFTKEKKIQKIWVGPFIKQDIFSIALEEV